VNASPQEPYLPTGIGREQGRAGGRRAGVLWTLGQSNDLNSNLVRFAPVEGVGGHVNDEVDVLVLGVSGRGAISTDGVEWPLGPGVVALVRRELANLAGATSRTSTTSPSTADGVRSISAAGPAEVLRLSTRTGAQSVPRALLPNRR